MLLGRIVMTIAPYKGKDKLRIAFRDKVHVQQLLYRTVNSCQVYS